MLLNSVSVGQLAASINAERSPVIPRKADFDMGKTKAKLAEFFSQNEAVRELCVENKAEYPRMHQSVQATAQQLVNYYINNWSKGKAVARNYEIRITHGYIKKAFNDSCCIATVKNHISKLMRMYKSFIKEKYRGGLGLLNQNTPCIVLVLDPKVLRFKDERHNKALEEGELSAVEFKRKEATRTNEERNAAQGILNAHKERQNEAVKRLETPSSFAEIFKTTFGASPKIE